ncbi:MAG: hypothetical protein JO253_06385 [Alphaproteobacteria bacterium]|nr:hypothetical protein [Alphaproteobacteria bacterium]
MSEKLCLFCKNFEVREGYNYSTWTNDTGFIGCDKRSDEAVDMSSEDGYRTWMLYADKCEHYTQFDYQEPSPPKQTPFCQWITCDKDSIPADLNYVVNIILIGSDESSGPHLVKDVDWAKVAFFQIIAIR